MSLLLRGLVQAAGTALQLKHVNCDMVVTTREPTCRVRRTRLRKRQVPTIDYSHDTSSSSGHQSNAPTYVDYIPRATKASLIFP